MISALVSQQEKDEAFAMLSYWNSPDISNLDVVDPSTYFEPYRYSQFLPFFWLDAGMSEAQVKAFTVEMRANLENENIALELRVPGANDYLVALGANVRKYINHEIELDEMIDNTLVAWENLTEANGGQTEQRDANRLLLGLDPIDLDAKKEDDGGNNNDVYYIVFPSVVGAVFLLIVISLIVAGVVMFFLKYKFHVILLPRYGEEPEV